MKEGPILMNGSMVRATLAGDKTQTRRFMRPQPSITDGGWHSLPGYSTNSEQGFREGAPYFAACPYGKQGDRLYVRETCRAEELDDGTRGVRFQADESFVPIPKSCEAYESWHKLFSYRGRRGAVVPSIHMPRWASRILLEITDLSAQRLQDITPADAFAEGAMWWMREQEAEIKGPSCVNERAAFASLWGAITAGGSDGSSWAANPWVWAVTFVIVGGNGRPTA